MCDEINFKKQFGVVKCLVFERISRCSGFFSVLIIRANNQKIKNEHTKMLMMKMKMMINTA